MVKWIREVVQCNCSKLYTGEVLKEKRKSGRTEKETAEAISRCKGRR